MAESWEVDCAAESPTIEEWTRINSIAEAAAGRISDSAGTGFGLRDMQWVCGTEEEANALAERLRKSELDFKYVQVVKMEEDLEDPFSTSDLPEFEE